MTAVLDSEKRRAKALDIGQGFGQHLRSFELILQRFTPLAVPQLIQPTVYAVITIRLDSSGTVYKNARRAAAMQ